MAGRVATTLFLIVLSWHLGLSMELSLVSWGGTCLAILAGLRLVSVERPTGGLIFVLFATGALTGNQVLENWAVEDSWPQDNGFGAGILISLLLYLLWRFAARQEVENQSGIDRDIQSVLVWGQLSLLMINPAEATMFYLFQEPVPVLLVIGMLLACLILVADRCGQQLMSRLALFAPLLLIVPIALAGLHAGRGPMIAALGNMMPSGGDYRSTGFSPYQTLRASVFLRPSNDPVMRIQTEAPPSRYLVGNRLMSLNNELIWLPSEQSLRSYSTLDADLLASDEWRYPIESNHLSVGGQPEIQMTVHSLAGDDYLFMPPGTTQIIGRFNAISRNAADVWTPNYERGADARWDVVTGGLPTPGEQNPETLQLPPFWDSDLQTHSENFLGNSRQATVDNTINYFLSRDYTLQTDFDPDQPFHDFYLNDRAGYCFWFASATTLALRANGIPSRLVGGYLLHEQIDDNLWLVRERDAHSWVEWQDSEGYWHTIDPTPASITAFFGGYESSSASQFYHRLAGQWQILIDRILENELAASAITWGGLAILVFLFGREYRRLRQRREGLDDLGRRWQKLWQRFLAVTALPVQPSWTPATYASNLPSSWDDNWRREVETFLRIYQDSRFGAEEGTQISRVEKSLQQLARVEKGSGKPR